MKLKLIMFLSFFLGLQLQSKEKDTDIITYDNVLYVNPQTVKAGATNYEIAVRLNNNVGIAGFQFDLMMPEGVTFDEEGISVSSERTKPERFLLTTVLKSNGSMGVLCGAIKDNPATGELWTFDGNDGVVITVPVNIPKDMTPGEYPVRLLNQVLADPYGKGTVAEHAEIAGTLIVVEADDRVLLDETSTTTLVASDGPVDVRVRRSFTANEWTSICLPFDMDENQLKTAFGEDFILGEFLGSWNAQFADDDAEYAQSIEVNFSPATYLNANQPYIIRTSRDMESFTVDGVTVQPEEVYQTFGSVRKGDLAEFHGTYVAKKVVDAGGLFMGQNGFCYSVGQTELNAFRCYLNLLYTLDYTDSEPGQCVVSFKLDDVTTGFVRIESGDTSNAPVYSLSGICLGKESDLSIFPKGVYIVNGKKVIKSDK